VREAWLLTVDGNIAKAINPELLFLRLSVVLPQQVGKMSHNRITLSQNFSVQLNDRQVASRIQPSINKLGLFEAWEFLVAVADIMIGDAGVFEEETDNLATATGEEV
jgi:hypothetical protein